MVGLTTPGAMLDDGNLSPRDISPICSIRWLTGEKIISKNTSNGVTTTNLGSRSRMVCVAQNERGCQGLNTRTYGHECTPKYQHPFF